jgi:hypothetical protein
MSEAEARLKECRDEVDKSMAVLHGRVDAFVQATATIHEIHDDVREMREILDAWNSAKGFVTTIKFLSAMIKWTAIVGGTVGVIWYFVKFGHLPPDIK